MTARDAEHGFLEREQADCQQPVEQPRTSRELTDGERSLLQIMREHQFGRIEQLPVHAGQPLPEGSMKIVRSARLGRGSGGTTPTSSDDFELNQAVRDLFAELVRLQHGLIINLEFRHGLPWLLETEAAPTAQRNLA